MIKFTLMKKGKIQSQLCLIFDLSSKSDLDHLKKKELLLAPPDIKEVVYESGLTRQTYIGRGFK